MVIDAQFNDQSVQLIEEGYDLVIRISALEDPGLVTKRLCNFLVHLCTSPNFLENIALLENQVN